MNSVAAVFLDRTIVPQCSRLSLCVGSGDSSAIRIQKSSGLESSLEFGHSLFDLGYSAVDVEVLGIGMAGHAGGQLRLKEVVVAFTQVARHAGILKHGIVRAGFAFHA